MNTACFNPIDYVHLVGNDISLSQTNVITLRFAEPHDSDEIRMAMRYMLSLYPKLRSIVEPTILSYRMRILDDNDPRLEILFRDSFRIIFNVKHESDEFLECRRNLINETFAIEQTIPIKIRYFPEQPQPVLLISLHHAIADGLGWINMANSLMSYLNGAWPSIMPVDNAHIVLPFLEISLSKILQQISRSFKMKEIKSRGTIFSSTNRPINYFGPVDVVYHTISISLDQLKLKARKSGVSISIIILAALSRAIIEHSERRDGEFIHIPVTFDLRKYYIGSKPIFGNFVYASSIRIHKKIGVKWIR